MELAQQALTDFLADYPDQVASARQLVVFTEENLTYAERDLERAQTTLECSEGALLSTWNAYVGQVYTYLSLVQGSWEVR